MFDSVAFWLTVVATAASWQLLPATAARARATVLAVASVIFIATAIDLTVANWVIIAASLAWYIPALRLLHRRRRLDMTLLACAPLAAVWTVGKAVAGDMEGIARFLLFTGLSFLVIKAFTLAKDVSDGRIKPPGALEVIAYLFFFPTYVAGPMHLYGEFARSLEEPRPVQSADILPATFRFVLGLFKVRVLSALLKPLSLAGVDGLESVSVPTLAGAAIVYSFVILFDFSGYSDMAIATARLVGVATPENFNKPFLAPNIRNFWQRWHITFSRVLTAYIFIPLTRAMQPRLGNRRVLLSSTAYLITFLFCGYWHGSGTNFLAWGLYHAVGLIAYDLYVLRRGVVRIAALNQTETVRAFAARVPAIVATFLFVSIGWILFVLPVERMVGLVG